MKRTFRKGTESFRHPPITAWKDSLDTHLSASPVGLSGLEGLFVDTGELKGVPLSVSLELSRQLLSRDDLLD